MKSRRTKTFIGWFLAGTVLVSSVAAADVIIGNGYNGAKEALKYTSKTLVKNSDSFTVDSSYEMKLDGDTVSNGSSTLMYDVANNKRIEISKSYDRGYEDAESYWYSDSEKSIRKSSGDDNYYQYNYSDGQKDDMADRSLNDPFDEDAAKDIERVADAFVSNMKDFVQISETDGGKMYFGNLNSEQIPAVANALASLAVKYSVFDEYTREKLDLPEITDSLYITGIEGRVATDADGLIKSFAGSGTVAGTDKNGVNHELVFNLSGEIRDINSTVVEAPDIPADKLVTSDARDANGSLSDMDAALYTSAIIAVKDNQYVKSGEIALTVDSVTDSGATGHITVSGDDVQNIDCDISAEFMDKSWGDYCFEYTENGETKTGILSRNTNEDNMTCGITVYLDVVDLNKDDCIWGNRGDCYTLTRVFDK